MWYGLVVNGELAVVQRFNHEPLIWDFHYGFFSSSWDYEIVEVDPVIISRLEPCR